MRIERMKKAVRPRTICETGSAEEVEEAARVPGPAHLCTSMEGGGESPEVIDNTFPDLDGYIVGHKRAEHRCVCLLGGLRSEE